jgi:GTP-binding protein
MAVKEARKLPRVAIVGRPNVGKSTLFNRLLGKRRAIVYVDSGTTRDVIEETIAWNGRKFLLADTGGMRFEKETPLQAEIEKQVERAVFRSDMILWVVDGAAGPHALDERLGERLRPVEDRTILVVNKIDDRSQEPNISEFYRLGFGRVFPVSALHGHGTGDLLDRLTSEMPFVEDERRALFTVVIVGEPNSGKSTYFNQLLREERAIVSPLPATTRDAIDEFIPWKGSSVRIVDTAGFGAAGKVAEGPTFYSLERTRRAVQAADVCLLFFDAYRGFLKNSKAIWTLVQDSGKACVLVANKTDLVEMKKAEYEGMLRARVPFLGGAPLEWVSALQGKNVLGPMARAQLLCEASGRKISTHDLNVFLRKFQEGRKSLRGARLAFLVQTRLKPPGFKLFVKRQGNIRAEYLAGLKNELMSRFGLAGISFRLDVEEAAKR